MVKLEFKNGQCHIELVGTPLILHTELSTLIVDACEKLAEKTEMNPHDILFPAIGLMWEHMTKDCDEE